MPDALPFAYPENKPPLDEKFLSELSAEELEFLKAQTRIESEEALKEHIISVQKKAYEIFGYPCIRFFSFARLKILHLPGYKLALKLVHDRPDAVYLDIGCCFGVDLRKVVADGWPIQNVIGSDLQQGFWDLGHELFKTTPAKYPAAFISGDIFDSKLIAPRTLSNEVPQSLRPVLNTLVSLTALQGYVSAIHASHLFHLFNEARQYELAQRLATLLSPLPGSVLFGAHIGQPEKGTIGGTAGEPSLFCHSPESWRSLWDGNIFEKGTVKVEAFLKQFDKRDMKFTEPLYFLVWSVVRL